MHVGLEFVLRVASDDYILTQVALFCGDVRFGASIGGHMNLNFVDCEKVRQLSKNLGFVYQGNFLYEFA